MMRVTFLVLANAKAEDNIITEIAARAHVLLAVGYKAVS